jgi:hypothetical protein
VLDSAAQVGCEVSKETLDIAQIKAAGNVLRGIIENDGQIR